MANSTRSFLARNSAITKQLLRQVRAVLLGLSLLLLILIVFLYWRQPDLFAIITIWPRWVWLGPGIVLALAGWSRARKRTANLLLILWLLYLLFFLEEPHSLVRFGPWPSPGWQAARARGQAFRLVSLNCAGSARAVAEVKQYHPDVLLLQESPNKERVQALAREIFGPDHGVVWSRDASILLRGSIIPAHTTRPEFFLRARALLAAGPEVEVVSTHLLSNIYDFELWSGEAWIRHTQRRRQHRTQMQEIVGQLATIPPTAPLIVGGDFNSPPGDAVFRLLRPRLRDAFGQAGCGWGNTVLNNMPVTRIDQVWINGRLRADAVVTRRTQYSDHRLVVCDLMVQDQAR